MCDFLRSKNGKKIRSDAAEVRFGKDTLEVLVTKYYRDDQMSAEKTSQTLREKHGIDISD
jgi:hypothetical protein